MVADSYGKIKKSFNNNFEATLQYFKKLHVDSIPSSIQGAFGSYKWGKISLKGVQHAPITFSKQPMKRGGGGSIISSGDPISIYFCKAEQKM